MARLYANENFPRQVVEVLRRLGHDVLTVQEADERATTDDDVLEFATRQDRAVVTINRKHFIRLHNTRTSHAGVIVCTVDLEYERQALRIHDAIGSTAALDGMLIRVNRPSK